ncbi:MAG: Gfo/Idh/MocA family oxidoreductase [Planctomycetia bacterium]
MAARTLKRRSFLATTMAGVSALPTFAQPATSRPAKKIRIGQIGVGHGHATKLAVYRASSDYEVVGLVEPDPALRAKAEQLPAFKDLPWMSQDQLLNTPGLQAVLIETRVKDSLNAAEACVTAGMHIHLDKPAGQSLPQFERILHAATQKKLLVQMGYMYRYNPGIVLLHEFLKHGWLGEVFEVHAVMSKVVPPADRLELAEYPGGIMFELGCHLMDLVVGILGEPADVTAFQRHSSPASDTLNDNMLAVLQYPNAIATLKTTAQEVDGGSRRHLTVCGTQGTFHIQPLDNPAAKITLANPHGRFTTGPQDVSLPKYTRYVDDAVEMAKILRGEKQSNFPPTHDLAVQKTLLKACNLPLEN